MEYCGGGSLSDLIMKGRFHLKEEEICYVMSEMLLGLAYLHEQKKIHRVFVLLLVHLRTSSLVTFSSQKWVWRSSQISVSPLSWITRYPNAKQL